jgi:hypothetical protein
MKMLLFIPGFLTSAFLTLSATCDAAPLGDGSQVRGFRSGFAIHRAGVAFPTARGIRPNSAFHSTFQFKDRRFLRHDRHVFLQPFLWPVYWYPYGDLNDYSYLDNGPDETYQYGDDSAAPAQLESSRPVVDHGPIIVILKTGNSGPADSSRNPGYATSAYSSADPAGQRNIAMQEQNERIGPRTDPGTVVPPAVPQPTQTVAKGTQIRPQAQSGPFSDFVLVSWLEEAGKDVIYVQNTETNDVQKITSEPNLDNFRIVQMHLNADPKLIEAVISNGSQQGPVRFHF